MRNKSMLMYDRDFNNVKNDPVKFDLILRSQWLFIHRGKNESTINNKKFDSWASRPEYVPLYK